MKIDKEKLSKAAGGVLGNLSVLLSILHESGQLDQDIVGHTVLTIAEKKQLAIEMVKNGASQRAAAKIAGLDHTTVGRAVSGRKRGGAKGTKNGAKGTTSNSDFEGCNAPDFGDDLEQVKEMTDDEITQHHVRYCVSKARDLVAIIRNEIKKGGNQTITGEMVDGCKEIAALFSDLTSDLKRRRKDIAHGSSKAKGRNGRSSEEQGDAVRSRQA